LRERGDIFVQAKVDGCGFENISLGKCYSDTKKMLERQLTELNLSYVDSAVLHFPPLPDMATGGCVAGICNLVRDQWRAMVEFYKANKTGALGVSNYCKNCYECLSPSEFDVLPHIHQIQYHLGMGIDKLGYVSYAKKHNMAIQAYSTLANKPEWFKWEPRGTNPQILSGKAFGGQLGAIAKAHNVSTIQIALKWIVQKGFTALTKSSSPKHLLKDSDLWNFDLTDAEMATLNYEVPAWPMSGADHGLHGIPAWACHPPGSDPGASAELLV
jgi:2,5-diketo-D-gluconate reductase A